MLNNGQTLLHYRILEKVGQGGMGEVYKAEDLKLGRIVALKIVLSEDRQDDHARQRLWREAKAASSLNHPNIVTIHALEQADGLDFFVMEYVEGESLRARLERGPLPLPELLDLGIQLADSLAAAHGRALLHRDIKPSNIVVTPRGQMKLLDFGLAKGQPNAEHVETTTELTKKGVIVGTVSYMSPEQAHGELLDGRSDLFSVGAVLYEAATGTRPFRGTSALGILNQITTTDPPAPSTVRRDLPREFDLIVARALAKDKEQRWASACELGESLQALRRGGPLPALETETEAFGEPLDKSPVVVDEEPVLAHVISVDIVGCSKLQPEERKQITERLHELVRERAELRRSRDNDQLIFLPAGDGIALAFFNKPDTAVQCAIEISKAVKAESLCQIRMAVHTGPVFVRENSNHARCISGAGINRAELLMSCGGPGHILLSGNVAESLLHRSMWHDRILEIGECRTEDGWVHVWNLVDGPIGNPSEPKTSKRQVQRRRRLMVGAAGAVLALVVAAALAGVFWLGRGKSSQSVQDKPSIAVLPFVNMSSDKDQEFFSDGLAEELLDALAQTPGLRVAGRTSSFQFKGQTGDFSVIGKKLNVATLLEGSVRKQGNRVRITTQLIKAADGFHLWSETFEREMGDIFAVQEEIAHAVTVALKVTLLEKKPEKAMRTTNVEAYNDYLHGRYFGARANQENLDKAVGYFEQAIKLDAGYAAAWIGLGESRTLQANWGYVPLEEAYRKAREAVERALALDPNLAEAHTAMGKIKMWHDWDWADADKSFQRARALEPADAGAITGAGELARILGRLDEAISLYRQALENDPLDPMHYHEYGLALHCAGRQKEAAAALSKAVDLGPELANAHCLLSRVYLAQSHPQEALAEVEKEKNPGFRLCGLALAYHALGRKKESNASLAELIAKYKNAAAYQVADVYAFRGETDQAFEWLERAYIEHDTGLTEMKGDPLLKSLVRDPRYAAFLKKMRLPL